MFETESCTNYAHVIVKMYKLLLKYQTEKEQVWLYDQEGKEFWLWDTNGAMGKNVGEMFEIYINLKESIYKTMFHWYTAPDKLAKTY